MTDEPRPTSDAPTPRPAPATPDPDSGGSTPEEPPRTPRPLLERIGMAVIALALAVMFGAISAASWAGGEPFLAVMGGIGCLMTIWVGALTLLRG